MISSPQHLTPSEYLQMEEQSQIKLLNSRQQRLECFRRSEAGWFLQSYSPAADPAASPAATSFELTSLQLTASLSDLYADVNLEATDRNAEQQVL